MNGAMLTLLALCTIQPRRPGPGTDPATDLQHMKKITTELYAGRPVWYRISHSQCTLCIGDGHHHHLPRQSERVTQKMIHAYTYVEGCKCYLQSNLWPNLFAFPLLPNLYLLFHTGTRYSVMCNVTYRMVRMHNTRSHPHSVRMSGVESIPSIELTTCLLTAGINARANVLPLCTSTITTTTATATATAAIYQRRF